MRVPEDGKRIYEETPIPKELGDVVNRAIQSRSKIEVKRRMRSMKQKKVIRTGMAAAAAALVCMTIGLNTSEVFAKEMSEIPVLGALARVLTVRSYHENDGTYDMNVEVPQIQLETQTGQNGETTEKEAQAEKFTGDINAEIQKIVDDYTETAKAEFEEYKKAFFETGGTEEEWGGREMNITVDYEVKYQKDNVLSLVLTASKAWVSAQEEAHYYNLDLATGKELTLKDLLGEDYVNICNQSIVAQIEKRLAEDTDNSLVYWGFGSDAEEPMIEGFQSVDENTTFYINEAGNVVVTFEKYEIAPGYMGAQEFEIQK